MTETTESQRTARLEALAAVRAMVGGRDDSAEIVIRNSEDPAELAHAACALAYSVLSCLSRQSRTYLLDRFVNEAMR